MVWYKVPYKEGKEYRVLYIKSSNKKELQDLYLRIIGKRISKRDLYYAVRLTNQEVENLDLEHIIGKDDFYLIRGIRRDLKKEN
ncbi:MAG: hypothetical protein KJ767_00160 [Nanoarchaeota archaeon]|nr:hypothetical protein [Nanoarchaeota archaeon]